MSETPGTGSAFFLYLRSFLSDRPTTEQWTFTAADGAAVKTLSQGTPKAALELLLEAAGPLIELGGPSHLGLGQVSVSDADWWESAQRLIIHSTAIFLNPDVTRSLAREIDLIIAHKKLLRRTFLLMEPTHETMLTAAYAKDTAAAADRAARWRRIRAFFRDLRIEVPDYDRRGAIISLYSPSLCKPFAGIRRYQLYDLMHEMYVDLTKFGSYDVKPGEHCPCGSGRAFASCHERKTARMPI
jgi:hypothetical protein